MKVKRLLTTAAAFILLLALPGCLLELLTTTAVQGELASQSAATSQKALQHAQGQTGQMQLNQAIQTYRAEKGVNPPSLEALVPNYIQEIPVQANGQPYSYDPSTGQLLGSAPQQPQAPSGPTANDMQKMQRITDAINAYGRNTGYYPPTLNDLTPAYIEAIPITDSGQSFQYNNQSGAVTHPGQAFQPQQQAQQPNRGASGGTGPLGETMTGIQMQQELNNMNQSGVNAAGNRARSGGRDLQTGRNSEIDNKMRELGIQ